MRSRYKKAACVFVCCVMMMALVPAAAFADGGADLAGAELLRSSETELTDQLSLHSAHYYRSDGSFLAENYYVFDHEPGREAETFPTVIYGNDVRGAASFAAAVRIEENALERSVIAGVNGDFFAIATGVPLGAIVKDGILRTTEWSLYDCVGFDACGKAVIGRPDIMITLTNVDARLEDVGPTISMLMNKDLTNNNGDVLYTSDYGASNAVSVPTENILLNIPKSELKIGAVIRTTVAAVFQASGAVELSDGQALICIDSASPYITALAAIRSFEVGDEVELRISAEPGWEDYQTVIGCEKRLVEDGSIVSYTDGTRAPRTALGITKNDDVIIYTADGRNSEWSTGMSLTELAERMKELGCVDAVNLDGGASTQIYAKLPGVSDLTLMNRPSSSTIRSCADYLVFERVRTAAGATGPAHLHVYPYGKVVLGGTKVELSVQGTDRNYQPAAIPGSVVFSAEGGVGTVSGSVFTAAKGVDAAGTVSASYGGIRGSATITVVSSPDSLIIKDPSGTALSGDQSFIPGKPVQLSVEAIYKRLPIEADAGCFTWTLEGAVGSIDESGLFTPAGEDGASGVLTVACGRTKASINVTIVTSGVALYSFEQFNYNFSNAAITAEPNSDLAFVHNGLRSEKLSYDFQTSGSAQDRAFAALGYSFSGGRYPTMLSMWVYGDGSGNELVMQTEGGAVTDTLMAKLDFTGWRRVSVSLPEQATRLGGFEIVRTEGGAQSGVIYLDQIVAGYGNYIDDSAPLIELSVSGGTVSGRISDDMDKSISASDVSMTLDGKDWPFSFAGGGFASSLDLNTGHHHIIVKATDESGNIARSSISYSSNEEQIEHKFTDMPVGNWATMYVEFLGEAGVINGKTRDGKIVYDPSAYMTRQEFAAVIIRWLGVDVSQYESVALDFSDVGQISGWALPSVRAIKAMGVMVGKESGFDPKGYITRQEAMTVLGRIQEKGYGENDLTSFSDASSVSGFALPYVRTFVHQGIISGNNGKLDPRGLITRAQVAKIIYELY